MALALISHIYFDNHDSKWAWVADNIVIIVQILFNKLTKTSLFNSGCVNNLH